MAATPRWHSTRCTLCDSTVLVRDDNERVTCRACGAVLDVMPSASGSVVRHVGEALDSVQDSLDAGAVQRALARLRERQAAHAVAASDALRTAHLRRVLALVAAGACVLGLVLAIAGHAGQGALVMMVGGFTLLGALGVRRGMAWGTADSDQRLLEREAERQAHSLAREIAQRENVLEELRGTRARG